MAKQLSKMPTRKLTVSMLIGPAATEVWGNVMNDIWPALAGTEMSMLVGALTALLVGYFVPDRVNI